MKWMRGKRFDMKTTVVVIVLALVAWGLVMMANADDFIPEELQQSVDENVVRPR